MKTNKELLEQDLPARIMHGVKGILIHDMREDFEDMEFQYDIDIFQKGTIWNYKGFSNVSIPMGEGDFEGFLIQHDSGAYTSVGNSIKPICHPMSDLTKPITHKGETFIIFDLIVEKMQAGEVLCVKKMDMLPFWIVEILRKYHFALDLPTHLWVDVNTLTENCYA